MTRNDSWRTVVLNVGLLPACCRAVNTCWLVSSGYWVMTWVLPSTGWISVSRRRCSLSSMSASRTLPPSIWASAVEVGTCLKPRVSSKSTLNVK